MSTGETRQTERFVAQSLRFTASHLHDSPDAPDWVLTSASLTDGTVRRVLDVGCGAGRFLSSVVDALGADEGVGLEPSPEAINLVRDLHAQDSRLSFTSGSAHSLPFPSDSFDLVICWSVLHWVGRNEYLQSLGELVRVCRRFLVIADFVAGSDYRVPYAHEEGLFTYKQDFVPAVLASGVMALVEDRRWWDGNVIGAITPISVDDLEPFLGNPLSYHSRRGALFVKDHSLLPLHTEVDFSG